MDICVEGPPLSKFSATRAVQMWWNSTTRRVNQGPKNSYRPRSESESTGSESKSSQSEDSTGSGTTLTLDDWDNWIL